MHVAAKCLIVLVFTSKHLEKQVQVILKFRIDFDYDHNDRANTCKDR